MRVTAHEIASTVPGIASRRVTVCEPEGQPAGAHFPLLVLHDGSNCLDTDPFGHGGWHAHRAADERVAAGRMAPAILVLVDNHPEHRAAEYVPGKGKAPGPTADAYLDFLERDVLPFVEARHPARPGPCAIGGSSFGAVISLHAGFSRPHVYGGVLAMSPSFAYDLARQVTTKRRLRIYLDSGTTDQYGGDDDRANTARLRDRLVAHGWVVGDDLLHVVGEGDTHSESCWRRRLPDALSFLFPGGTPA